MPFKQAVSHSWDISFAQAKQIQLELAQKVSLKDQFVTPRYIAGVDVGFENGGRTTRAAIAVLNYPELKLVDQSVIREKTVFPYVPGYLSFRELPAVLAALNQLDTMPDMFLCDGQGIAHPRRFGIACHLGVLTDIPSIGVAKSRLTGTYTEPGMEKGDASNLYDKQERIGVVLRTRTNVKPLFISPGHKICIESAVQWALNCTTRYRLPETTRAAHHLASGTPI